MSIKRHNNDFNTQTGIRTFNAYDGMGRLARVSVPQVDDPDTYAWTLNGYEASPRNMLVMKTLPGQLWYSQNKASRKKVYTNSDSVAYSCYRLSVNSSDGITMNGSYAPGTLMIEEATDEDGYITRTFTDLDGRVVKTSEGRGTDFLSTYNVYDDYGRLRYVLPPNVAAGSYASSHGTLAKKAFIYKYDSRGRLVYTKTPGCAAEEIRYSPAGRVVARHTPSMPAGHWILYFYDRYGREVLQAQASLTTANLNILGTKLFVAEFDNSSSYGGYKIIGGFPTAITPLKATYYDTYDFASGADADLLGTVPRIGPKGFVTGVRDFTATSSGLTTVTIYNADGFVSAINSRMLNGRQMRTFTTDRRGKVLTEREVFTHSSGKVYTRVTTNTYDHAERLTASTVVENGKTARIERSYGNNGLLSLEKFGNKLNRTYSYDIHGWLTKSHLTSLNSIGLAQSDTKSEEYYSPLGVGGSIITPPSINVVNLTEQLLYAEGSNALYSGCPSGKITIQGGRYDYTFDNHRRLTEAKYSSHRKNEDFSTSYTYDAVANPEQIVRMGVINVSSTGAETFGILDSLYYCYDGNQIDYVGQFGQGTDFYGRTGYPLQDGTYTWNEAGLLNSDSSRGILSTTYNHLGLPVNQIYKTNATSTASNRYTYSADGALLRLVNVVNSLARYYSGSRIFDGNNMEYSYFPGGYFDASGAVHYTHTDYQGSIIAVTDSLGKVVQTVGYYPYGEPWREPSGQPMLFAGKERTPQADYHFDPRNYNPSALFWHAPDQLAGQFRHLSPYSYCAGNPILYTDPTGKRIYLDKNLNLEQVFTVLLYIQNLTDDHVVYKTQKDGSRMVIIDRLGTGKKKNGTELIRFLNSSSVRIDVSVNNAKDEEGNGVDEFWTETTLTDGKAVSCHVNTAPGESPSIAVYDKETGLVKMTYGRPDYIGLAHEFIHCMHHIEGSHKRGYMYHPKLPGKLLRPIDEYETIGISGNRKITENSIRKENGLEERALY